ncbi:MAG: hypothetical protein ACK53G_13630 [Armatimonadota bacterium]|jgi:hypothetical protein|nr:hypothetical protein [Fimbriimonadales bacterium]
MIHPTADYIARIQRREHEHHHTAQFKLVGEGVPEMEFTDAVKVFGDVVEVHAKNGMDYFIPVHQIRYLTHPAAATGEESKGWIIHI